MTELAELKNSILEDERKQIVKIIYEQGMQDKQRQISQMLIMQVSRARLHQR